MTRRKTFDFQAFQPSLGLPGTQAKRGHLPLQVHPSPKYPVLHEQVYDPMVLLHTASALQLWVSAVEHSSKSEISNKDVQLH